MPETIEGVVLYVVGPDERDDGDLDPELAALAASRNVVVCRRGGSPSLLRRAWALLRGETIEAVTVVTDRAPEEGERFEAEAVETEMTGVYEEPSPSDSGRA